MRNDNRFVRWMLFLIILVLLTQICGCAFDPGPSAGYAETRKSSWDRPETQTAAETEPASGPDSPAETVYEVSHRSLYPQLEQQAKDVLNGKIPPGSVTVVCHSPFDLGKTGRMYCMAETENENSITAVCDRIIERVTTHRNYGYFHNEGTNETQIVETCESSHAFAAEHVIRKFSADVFPTGIRKLSSYAQEYLHVPLLLSDNPAPFVCYSGNDWIVFFTDEFIPGFRSVHAIYRMTEDGELREFGHHNALSQIVTGACILSETTGFLCQSFMKNPYQFGFALFGTFDGGETWTDMGLELPEKYDDYTDAAAFFPYFEGDRGIVFIGLADESADSDWNETVCCFITEDGGRTWTFRE